MADMTHTTAANHRSNQKISGPAESSTLISKDMSWGKRRIHSGKILKSQLFLY